MSYTIYFSINNNTNMSYTIYFSINNNTNMSYTIYFSINNNTDMSYTIYFSINNNANMSYTIYFSINNNTNMSYTIYFSINPIPAGGGGMVNWTSKQFFTKLKKYWSEAVKIFLPLGLNPGFYSNCLSPQAQRLTVYFFL